MHDDQATARQSWPVWLPSVFGVLWLASIEFIIRTPQSRVLGAIGFGLAGVLLIVGVVVQWLTDRRRQHPPDGAVGTLVLLTSAVGAAIFSGGMTSATQSIVRQLSAHLVALSSAFLIVAWFHHQERRVADILRGRFAIFIMSVALWWTMITLLSWATFISLSVWWVIGIGTIVSALAALVVWWDAYVRIDHIRQTLIPTIILGVEVCAISWWLPTAVLVGATAATAIFVLYIQISRHLWLGTWQTGRGRRYAIVGAVVIGLTLLTARWF